MTDTRYWQATEPAAITKSLLERIPIFSDHGLVPIHHAYTNQFAGEGAEGCKTLARTKKVGGLESALIGGLADDAGFGATPIRQFAIVYEAETWAALDDHQREALVYHELCHIDPVEGRLRRHDFTGFNGEIALYGPWTFGLRSAQAAFSLHLT